MNKHKLLSFIFLLILLNTFLACRPSQTLNSSPNVLMISIDDLNDWIGVLRVNPNVKTPNIDRLAKEGFLFTNAHCQAPICGPSRASLLSGLRPSTTGIYGQIRDENLRKAHPILNQISFLPEYFANNGYKTLGVGKIFHGHAPKGVFQVSGGRIKGFGPKPKKFFKWSQKGTSTDWGIFPNKDSLMYDFNYANWAKNELEKNHNSPFFMAVGFIRPHVPWYVPKKWFDLYPIEDISLPKYDPDDYDDLPKIAKDIAYKGMMPTTDWAIKNGEWKYIIQAYLACVSFVDHQVGLVLNGLEKSIYKDNTIVVLWSDHGYEMGEKGTFGKHTLWSESTRVPLIIKLPWMKGGKKINNPVELLDLYPTLLEVTNLPKNPLNEGKSLVSQITGRTEDSGLAITTYGLNNHSLINQTHRYIRYEDGSEELYDLINDPNERNNIANQDGSNIIKRNFIKHIPSLNEPWSTSSYNTVNDYFKRTSNSED